MTNRDLHRLFLSAWPFYDVYLTILYTNLQTVWFGCLPRCSGKCHTGYMLFFIFVMYELPLIRAIGTREINPTKNNVCLGCPEDFASPELLQRHYGWCGNKLHRNLPLYREAQAFGKAKALHLRPIVRRWFSAQVAAGKATKHYDYNP